MKNRIKEFFKIIWDDINDTFFDEDTAVCMIFGYIILSLIVMTFNWVIGTAMIIFLVGLLLLFCVCYLWYSVYIYFKTAWRKTDHKRSDY